MITDTPAQRDFDFENNLPTGVESFSLHWIARRFGGTVTHWFNRATKGAFGNGIVDLRTPGSSKAMLRIPRRSLVKFLNSRRDIEAVADSNPQPKPREQRKRSARRRKTSEVRRKRS
jgi:hypothetical protein